MRGCCTPWILRKGQLRVYIRIDWRRACCVGLTSKSDEGGYVTTVGGRKRSHFLGVLVGVSGRFNMIRRVRNE